MAAPPDLGADSLRPPLDAAQTGAAGARIARGLVLAGAQSLARHGGKTATAYQLAEALFDRAVLQRMIRQHDHPAARAELRRTAIEQRRQTFELMVDRDAQRLEGSRRWMYSA